MNTTNVPPIAMELRRIFILKNNVADIGVDLTLHLLGHFVAIKAEEVLLITNFNNGVGVKLALKGIRILSLIYLFDL